MTEIKTEASSILTDEESNRLYLDDPDKFLKSFGPKKLMEKDLIVDTVRSIFRIQIDASVRLIRGVKIKCTAYSLPYFGSLYQQRGCNFAVFNNNINHYLDIPPDKTPKEFSYLKDDWYFNIIRTCFGIANLANALLIFNCILVCTMSYLQLFELPSQLKAINIDIMIQIMLIYLLGFGVAVGDMSRTKADTKNITLAFSVMVTVSLGMVFEFIRLEAMQSAEVKQGFLRLLNRTVGRNNMDIHSWTRYRIKGDCCGSFSYLDWLHFNHTLPSSCCPPSVPVCNSTHAFEQGCFNIIFNFVHYHITIFQVQAMLVAGAQIAPITMYYMYLVALRFGSQGEARLDLNMYPLIENFYTIAKGQLEDHLPIFLFYFEKASVTNADDDLVLALLLHEINIRMNAVDNVKPSDPKFLFYTLY